MGKNIKKSEIEKLIVQGYSTAEIAKKMNYSIGTIRNFYTELREEGKDSFGQICFNHLFFKKSF